MVLYQGMLGLRVQGLGCGCMSLKAEHSVRSSGRVGSMAEACAACHAWHAFCLTWNLGVRV